MRTRAALSILVALWLIALATATAHADEAWTITSFHSDIQIAADSALTITETVNVDFGSLERHGIFRTIPLRYRYDDTHDRYYELSVGSVTDGARPIPYTTSIESDNEVIKIGDPKDRKSTRLNSSHRCISYAVLCLQKKNSILYLR